MSCSSNRTMTRPGTGSRTGSLPTDPCQLLALARQQLFLLMSGQGVAAIETPELGRVEFAASNVADLQRLIDSLAGQCAAAGGQPSGRRRPISVEAWP